MKKKYALLLSALTVLIITSISIIFIKTDKNEITTTLPAGYSDSEAVINNIDTGITVIDESCTYQTMLGFGCSSYQWAHIAENSDLTEDIISLLYSDTKGIGLNVYRYNLGAGSMDDETIKNPLRRTESFLTDSGKTDFNKDASAQNSLSVIKSYAGDGLRVILYADSPPVQLTKNGKAYSDAPEQQTLTYSSNLSSENYRSYAEYLYSCCEYFTSSGYTVTAVSPVNEPSYSHRASTDTDGNNYVDKEGCFFLPDELTALYGEIASVFKDTPVSESGVKIMLPECGEAQGEGSSIAAYLDNLLSSEAYQSNSSLLSDNISVHSYWSSKEKKLQFSGLLQTVYPGKGVYCTDYSQLENDGNSGILEYLVGEQADKRGLSIKYALRMSDIIMTDLTAMNASLWCWSSAYSTNNTTDALIYPDETDSDTLSVSKRLWCLGNFSRFIDEGAVRLAASSGNSSLPMVAFRNTDGSYVCVYLNNSEFDITTDMSSFLPDSHDTYITDEFHDLESIRLTENKVLTVPAFSIVSVVY